MQAAFTCAATREEGTTTTPLDMVVLNETSRFHIAMDAIRRSRRPPKDARGLTEACVQRLLDHRSYIATHFEDMPEIRDFTWTDG